MLIMVVCYTIMGKELWGSKSIGEHTQRQYESVKSKKKVRRFFSLWLSIRLPTVANIAETSETPLINTIAECRMEEQRNVEDEV